MGIYYKNLDEKTREFMLKELEMDTEQAKIYISTRLNALGQSNWVNLLKEAITNHNDDWLAHQLTVMGYMNTHETKKDRTVKVPLNAPETLAEGEFNRYYVRGLCARAISEGINEVVVYRGKDVQNPRIESQYKIGQRVKAKDLLEDLRISLGVEPALGIPPGPNSGLTICLP